MNKIRKGDTVVVTTGRDKGRTGTVVNILASGRVLVENVNMVKKHQRPNPATKKADKVGRKLLEDGRKVRYLKSNGEVVDS